MQCARRCISSPRCLGVCCVVCFDFRFVVFCVIRWTVGIQRKYTACMLASGECSEQPLLVVMWVTLAFSVFFCLEMAIKVCTW